MQETVLGVLDSYIKEQGLKPLEEYERRPVYHAFYSGAQPQPPTPFMLTTAAAPQFAAAAAGIGAVGMGTMPAVNHTAPVSNGTPQGNDRFDHAGPYDPKFVGDPLGSMPIHTASVNDGFLPEWPENDDISAGVNDLFVAHDEVETTSHDGRPAGRSGA